MSSQQCAVLRLGCSGSRCHAQAAYVLQAHDRQVVNALLTCTVGMCCCTVSAALQQRHVATCAGIEYIACVNIHMEPCRCVVCQVSASDSPEQVKSAID